jgi:cellulose synthase/poly-beta-1,6-N-acetylglucosamine synthase-like glycosyltransferase
MRMLEELLWQSGNLFNLLILSYFFLGNGVYTILMLRSLVSVWIHNRRHVYQGLDDLHESAEVAPVTIIMPAWNEEAIIADSVRAALQIDYPHLEVIVVDDGSTDQTLERLITAFQLVKMDLSYRRQVPALPVREFYLNPAIPNLLVVSKENRGKSDALNAGINLCRTPYFCTLDSDCLLERDALLRLMHPIVNSPIPVVVSGGIVRILNGCQVQNGTVVKVGLPEGALERFQVVEYLRTFLFGRTGWDQLGGTLIMSGAFALFRTDTVIEVGGFRMDTVAEDMDLIVEIHRWAARQEHPVRMSFVTDPVCWTECPSSLAMLARQRRRWQLGLCQTLWKHSEMLFRRKYGAVGMVSFPFHLYVEGLGAAVEFVGYLLVPFAVITGMVPLTLCALFLMLGLAYGAFLSVGAVLLEELTYRRYPNFRELTTLLVYALLENAGYRQIVLLFRLQGVMRFLAGLKRWEKVVHVGPAPAEP